MVKKVMMAALLLISANAQAFLVSDLSGERLNIRDLSGDGRWMVVMLWQLQCVLCEEHKPVVEAFHQEHVDAKAHVVGLVMDGHEYMEQIQAFIKEKPTGFPSHVVFGDVFSEQIMQETGKSFHTAPGYLVYAPDGELKLALNSRIAIEQLIDYLEEQMEIQ